MEADLKPCAWLLVLDAVVGLALELTRLSEKMGSLAVILRRQHIIQTSYASNPRAGPIATNIEKCSSLRSCPDRCHVLLRSFDAYAGV
jgi:hypothetical protein